MENQPPNPKPEEPNLPPLDMAEIERMESHDWLIKESAGDEMLLRLLALREKAFDRRADPNSTKDSDSILWLNYWILHRKQVLGLQPPDNRQNDIMDQ